MRFLTRELSLVLVVKILLLFMLWYFCFSNPIARKLDTHKLAQHLLGSSQTK